MTYRTATLAVAVLFASASAKAEPTRAEGSRAEGSPECEPPERCEAVEGERKEHENDFTLVPYGGGDSDIGIGGGIIVSLAHLTGVHRPYLWRVESVSLVTVKTQPELEFPYVDAYALLSLPHAIKDRLKLDFRVSYTRELTLKYFGLGNASSVPDDVSLGDPRHEYERVHPTLRLRSESRVWSGSVLILGVAYTKNWIDVPQGTLLAEDRVTGNERVRQSLQPESDHSVLEFSYGLGWDDRDNPVSTTSGHYHTARIDLAPGGFGDFPQRWARLNGATRFYVPFVARRLSLAVRGVGDMLLGDPPFYELPRYDDTSALGGTKGVRGIPAQRYYGKVKLFANVELRSRLFDFRLFGQKNTFGVVAFADGGRLWSDLPSDPTLDGTDLGLKYGLGGGLRLHGGRSFVVRADAAWSPDARPIGAYLGAGEVF